MAKKESQEGLTVGKENFSEWYSQVLQKAEVTDMRFGVKGFIVIRPWGALTLENMFRLYEKELQSKGHLPTIMPIVIPEANLKKESSHVKGFTPEVFWIEQKQGDDKLALRPTSETVYTPMFGIWVRSYNDLPMKLYQRGPVFRYDTKSTRPLIRGREFHWIEAHDAFATKKEAEAQVQEDIQTTEKVMHGIFGIPFLPMKRPVWDMFAGAEYTVASDVLMPDGKIIQQPSTHLMGQKFSKAFDVKFKNENGKEDFLWTTAYGPAMSRILASVISIHGDDHGLVMPFAISPIKAVIVPILKKGKEKEIAGYAKKVKEKLKGFEIKIDDRENYSPGWKFNEWELKGVPFRIEIGEKEVSEKKITLYSRDTGKKEKILLSKFPSLKNLGEEYDKRLKAKADSFMNGKIEECKTKVELEKCLENGKIAKTNFCSVEKSGVPCAEVIERDMNAEVRGTMANKNEKPKAGSKCIICGKPAKEVVYIGKSY